MDKPYQRILTAFVGVPVLYIIFYLGGIWFLILFLLIILLAQYEFLKLLENNGYVVQKGLMLLSSVFLPVAAYYGFIYAGGVFIAFIFVSFLIQLMRKRFENILVQVGVTVFGITYISFFLSYSILLRNIDQNSNIKILTDNMQSMNNVGFFLVIFVVTCTFLNDTGAYYIGKWKGKRKLSPDISPGKTVEGTLGGIITAIVTGGIVNLIFKSPLPHFFALVFALIVSLAAIFGDLFESMIKRSVGAKDSGAILPGHGGILDRFDSLILVFPVSYYSILYYCFMSNGFKF
jgi:phosphatidate cytidylyltransferase